MKNNFEIKSKNNGISIITDDTLNIEPKKKANYKIGFQVGSHSPNLNQFSSDKYNRGIIFDIYLKFNLSSEIHSIIAFTYWEAQINESNSFLGQIPSETIISKGLKLGLDFSLFNIYKVFLSGGTSISIVNINKAENVVFSLGTNLKLNLPLWNDKVNLFSMAGYQTGAEILRFNYSFFSYSLGLEINIGN